MYHMTTTMKLEIAVEKHGQTHQAVACYHMHIYILNRDAYMNEYTKSGKLIAIKIIKTIM